MPNDQWIDIVWSLMNKKNTFDIYYTSQDIILHTPIVLHDGYTFSKEINIHFQIRIN